MYLWNTVAEMKTQLIVLWYIQQASCYCFGMDLFDNTLELTTELDSNHYKIIDKHLHCCKETRNSELENLELREHYLKAGICYSSSLRSIDSSSTSKISVAPPRRNKFKQAREN